ncbi:T9SS type A sorting domain-containing protein [Xanthomarina sp. F2636L]|uniref:T9SS type A sorting domain-containing protein n=1 Tax=Xanthomarina sp. F2636L TaxID=2996018 RepID=UPI00225E3B6E|nr:T9SS type A sorting domain-containing protein [Xanthomarina sp. F2636L]MCX7549993.1 T9SS type A sorting domain-containing protein [Xanthomarina sp. F2636L]
MKNYYLLVLSVVAIFSFNHSSYSQSCPPTGFTNGSSLYFFYDAGGMVCGDRPNTVSVGPSEFTLSVCESGYSIYNLTSGDVLSDLNPFTADFGFGTCEYTNGNLSAETLSIEQVNQVISATRVFPNPMTTGNNFHLVFNSYVYGTASMFDITGKKVLNIQIDNLNRKQLDVSSLANGVYLLKIEAGSSSTTKKVVIMK